MLFPSIISSIVYYIISILYIAYIYIYCIRLKVICSYDFSHTPQFLGWKNVEHSGLNDKYWIVLSYYEESIML